MSDFIQIPPDSSGKRMKTVYHPDQDTHVQATHNVSTDNPEFGQHVDASGAAFMTFSAGNPTFDSYNRLHVTDSIPVFTTDFSNGTVPPFEFSKAGDVVVEESGALRLSTGTAPGEMSFLQTDKHFRYTPGYSTSFLFTMAVGDAGKANVMRRMGAFCPEEGLYFQVDEFGLSVNIRNEYTGNVTQVRQEDFNGDKFDGTGLTKRVLDLTKDNFYWIEYQWQGAGAVSFGTYVDGQKVLMHRIDHFGKLSMSYTRSGRFPFRVEQFNEGMAASSSEFRLFCISVSECVNGKEFSNIDANSEFLEFTIPANEEYHFITIRPTQTNAAGRNNREFVTMNSLQIFTSGMVRVLAVRDADIGGAEWQPFSTSTITEKTHVATWQGGLNIGQRLIQPGQLQNISIPSPLLEIVRKADITESQTLTLLIIPVGNDPVDVITCASIQEG